MIRSFKNSGTEDTFNGKNTRAARKTCPESLWQVAARKLDQLDSVVSLNELCMPPGNRLEALSGDRKGQPSIRVNEPYRIWDLYHAQQTEVSEFKSTLEPII